MESEWVEQRCISISLFSKNIVVIALDRFNHIDVNEVLFCMHES